jgi:hypothetical protein
MPYPTYRGGWWGCTGKSTYRGGGWGCTGSPIVLAAGIALCGNHLRILEAAEVLKYVAPFIRPYYRATAYSGDQIGMMCCSDLEAALEATRRLLVGGELASELTAGAVMPQALLVKRRLLPRLVQLLAVEPHVTNRYANLLCFGRYHAPELWARMLDSMGEHEQRCLEEIWQRSPYRWRVAAA